MTNAAATLPTLETGRLTLRPFTLADAGRVRELAGAPEVAATTLNIPHPYPEGAAEGWIGAHAAAAEKGEGFSWAMVRKADDLLLGAIGLGIATPHRRAAMGYWLGVDYWNQGYTSEAARRVIAFGFEELGLHRVQAGYLPRNPASGRVMRKAGMTYEGTLRDYVRKGGRFEDVAMCAILRAEWERPPAP
jgi:RimJ/RimL family protein N-acetyltransferase